MNKTLNFNWKCTLFHALTLKREVRKMMSLDGAEITLI